MLKAKVSAPQSLPTHGVTTVFVELDNTKIELLLPLGDMSPIQVSLKWHRSSIGAHALSRLSMQHTEQAMNLN